MENSVRRNWIGITGPALLLASLMPAGVARAQAAAGHGAQAAGVAWMDLAKTPPV